LELRLVGLRQDETGQITNCPVKQLSSNWCCCATTRVCRRTGRSVPGRKGRGPDWVSPPGGEERSLLESISNHVAARELPLKHSRNSFLRSS